MKITENNVIRDMTSEEEAHHTKIQSDYVANTSNRKLAEIRKIRNKKLSETDYLGVSDNTMSDAIKTWRTNLRNIPQDNTTESKYDELLERKDDGSLKHSIWEKP
tara:strand:+ start:571 stop:885 length:315 start_codon:yes stop_codon:yes gene_type:complete